MTRDEYIQAQIDLELKIEATSDALECDPTNKELAAELTRLLDLNDQLVRYGAAAVLPKEDKS